MYAIINTKLIPGETLYMVYMPETCSDGYTWTDNEHFMRIIENQPNRRKSVFNTDAKALKTMTQHHFAGEIVELEERQK